MSANQSASIRARCFFCVPWSAFVAAFLYYVVLTLFVIGGHAFSTQGVTLAYLLPGGFYAGFVLGRGLRWLNSLPVEIGETPAALLR